MTGREGSAKPVDRGSSPAWSEALPSRVVAATTRSHRTPVATAPWIRGSTPSATAAVHRPVPGAEDDERGGEQHRAGCSERQQEQGRVNECREPQHARARTTVEDVPGERHGDERAGSHEEEHDPDRRLGHVEPVLDEGDLRDPGPDERPVDEEADGGGCARGHVGQGTSCDVLTRVPREPSPGLDSAHGGVPALWP